MFGECTDIRLLDGEECVRVVNEHRELIVGVKVRVGKIAAARTALRRSTWRSKPLPKAACQ